MSNEKIDPTTALVAISFAMAGAAAVTGIIAVILYYVFR